MEISIHNSKIKRINQCNYVIEAIQEYHNKGCISKRLTVLSIKQIIDKAHIFDQKYSKNNKFFWYRLYKTNNIAKPLLAQFSNLTNLFILVKIIKEVPMYELIQKFKEYNFILNKNIYDIMTIVKTIKKAAKMKYRNINFEIILNEVLQKKFNNSSYSKKKLMKDPLINTNGNSNSILISNEFLSYKKRKIHTQGITSNNETYKNIFNQIDKIISSCFVFYKDEFKWNNTINKNISILLGQCSFDIEAFFNYLKYKERHSDEEAKEKFLFSSSDDYIILQMPHSDIYKELINLKGEVAVKRRTIFLVQEN